MECGNQTSDIDSDGDQNIVSFSKLSLHPLIDTHKENEVIFTSQTSNHKQRKRLAKLLKRYKGSKEKLIANSKDLCKVCSILRRDKRKTISFEEYRKLVEHKHLCEIIDKKNYIDLHLPQSINTIKKLSKYSVEELEEITICINSHSKNESDNIEEFLQSFGSTQIKKICLLGYSFKIQNENLNSEDEYSTYYEVYPCSIYFYGLRDVMSKATKSIDIRDISFSSKEFSAILRAAKHVKEIDFNECKILAYGECELGEMEGCQIECLWVYYRIHVYKHSRDYEEYYMKIFLSIVGCPNFLRSLKQIRFKCGREMKKKLLSKAKEILGNDYDIIMPSFYCL